MKKNYHKIMMKEIEHLLQENKKPRLLLHSCCAPCSSYVLKFLSDYFDIEVYYFNPNIYPLEEYEKRMAEQIELVKKMGFSYKVVENEHNSKLFYDEIKGYEKLGEGSERCAQCYRLRLRHTAKYARDNYFDYFTTTLTISPMKNAHLLNEIGLELGKEYGINFLQSDFKKNDGYKCSIELSKEYNLYRQDYCGCAFSKQEAEKRRELM